jgi:hypothetical protein
MSDLTYAKILFELSELEFSGVVQFFNVNDPLLDSQLSDHLRRARSLLPRACLYLSTNWDLHRVQPLEAQLFEVEKLYAAGLNALNVNDYSGRNEYQELVNVAAARLNLKHKNVHYWQNHGPRARVISCGGIPAEFHNWTGYVQIASAKNSRPAGATALGPRATWW